MTACLLLVLWYIHPLKAEAQQEIGADQPYAIELLKWGIYSDGTHASETVDGINNALQWAAKNKITAVTLPAGTYLIDKDKRINMVSNMRFQLPNDAILMKERNNKERYELMYLGYGVDNVSLIGGKYVGDKDTHDYGSKGTHEFGFGISTEGATNLLIDGVVATGFTGDGLILGGYGTMIQDVYEKHFIAGAINEKGKPISSTSKIRTKTAILLNNPIYKMEKTFELSNLIKLPKGFELYFYKADGSFLKKIYAQGRQAIEVPAGAASYHISFSQSSAKGAYLEIWYRTPTRNVVVKNSEFAFNRRQGITVGGADQVLIKNSIFHDIKGTLPQAGIDVEGGFDVNGYLNTNVTIQNNEFYNNSSYDIVLYDGRGAIVEGNHLASEGKVGLSVSEPFTDALIRNNHFDKSSLYAAHDTILSNNQINDSVATFNGPGIVLKDLVMTDSSLALNSKAKFGIEASNITMTNNKKGENGLFLWGKAAKLTNVSITGESTLRSVAGGGEGGSLIDNLQVLGYNSVYGLQLPPGTYRNSRFVPSDGGKFGMVSALLPGKYVFEKSSFATNKEGAGGLLTERTDTDLTVRDTTFDIQGNGSAINVQAARSVLLENNTINAPTQTQNGIELIKINSYWNRDQPFDVLEAVIRGNIISSNLQSFGISTQYAGVDAPPYKVENNTLNKSKLTLKANDEAANNRVAP